MLRLLTALAGLGLLSPVVLLAADKAKADGIVQEVLGREVTAEVSDRSSLLRGIIGQNPKSATAHWAAGHVAVDDAWQPVVDRIHDMTAEPMLAEYRAIRDAAELTPTRHRELAEWCRQHELTDQERAHFWAGLAANPQQPKLWKRLGHRLVDGQWITEEQERAVERLAVQRQRDLKRWQARAENLATRLASPNSAVQSAATRELREIDDPAALPAFEAALTISTADSALSFVHWAGRIDCYESTLALARQALIAPWDLVRTAATEALHKRRLSDFVEPVLSVMTEPVELIARRASVPQWGQPLVSFTFRRELRDHIEARTSSLVLAPNVIETIFVSRRRGTVNRMLPAAGEVVSRERQQVDQLRAFDDRLVAAEALQEAVNAELAVLNSRASACLASATGESPTKTPKDWWEWWGEWASLELPSSKPTVEVAESETVRFGGVVRVVYSSCLPAGTPVLTEVGPRPIETIRLGDRVLSKEVETGELAFRPVLKTTVRSPQPLVKLAFATETIQATPGHHFWVSGQGWRMARELRPGHRLHGLHGTVTVTDTATGDTAAVYNLVVDRAQTYFVGDSLVLSHDVTSPAPTNVKVPGLPAR